MLWAIALAGCAAAAATLVLGQRSDHVSEPGLQAAVLEPKVRPEPAPERPTPA
jgi:hypothetical protein